MVKKIIRKKIPYEYITGNIYNSGSKKENIARARRMLKNKRFKGKWQIETEKTPKAIGQFVEFQARRRSKK